MLVRTGGLQAGLVVQVVGQADVHHVHLLGGQQLVDVAVGGGNAVGGGEGFGVRLVAAIDRHDLCVVDETGVALGVDIGDEAGAQQGDLCLAHGKDPPFFNSAGKKHSQNKL